MSLELRNYGELDAFLSALSLCGKKVFFNFLRDNGKLEEYQSDSYKVAETRMNEDFSQECEENGIENGELIEECVDLLVIDADSDDETIIATLPVILECEGYHGDFKEHFNQRDFI